MVSGAFFVSELPVLRPPTAQFWLFWVMPLLGAVLAGLAYPVLAEAPRETIALDIAQRAVAP